MSRDADQGHRLPRQVPHKVLDARLPAMVAHIIGFVLQNLPALFLGRAPFAEVRYAN
jgi:hypothetical protein